MQTLLVSNGIWHDLVISGDPAQVERLQDDIGRALDFYQFADREVFAISLAVDEALANAVKHGNRMDRRKKIFIRYRVSGDRFDIRIADQGRGFSPDAVADPTDKENLERPGGRGLLLLRHYMTEVVFHPPGNRLSMSLVRHHRGDSSW